MQMLKEKYCLPPLDQAYSALLEDLSARGLLDETLVVMLGEFGRTPKINPAQGRDHWGACQVVVLAGGGIRGGQVYGASDAHAAYPKHNPVSPEDLIATMYHALGIPPDSLIYDRERRPHKISRRPPAGRVVRIARDAQSAATSLPGIHTRPCLFAGQWPSNSVGLCIRRYPVTLSDADL